jgi:hypothetical protein
MYLICLYEKRTVKCVEIVLRKESRVVRENDGEGEYNQGTL